MMDDDSAGGGGGGGDWSGLHHELVRSISQVLTTNIDYIRFRAVCSSWRSATTASPCHHLPCQSPWLLLPREQEEGQEFNNTPNRSFLSIPEHKLYNIHLPEDLGLRCFGSSHGWMFLSPVYQVEAPITPIYLLNPITRSQFYFPPPFESEHDPAPTKIVFLSSPNHDTAPTPSAFLATLTMGEVIYIFKPGDQSWTTLTGSSESYQDAIFYKDRFYTVDFLRKIFAWDLGSNTRRLTEVPCVGIDRPWLRPHSLREWCYLVELSGDLLLIIRLLCLTRLPDGHKVACVTKKFQVYKLNLDGQTTCIEVDDLGDRMLFLGLNTSISLSATDYSGWKGNHIYFTADILNYEGDNDYVNDDTGVFNLEDGSIEPLPSSYVSSSARYRPPPIWITPSLS